MGGFPSLHPLDIILDVVEVEVEGEVAGEVGPNKDVGPVSIVPGKSQSASYLEMVTILGTILKLNRPLANLIERY